ASITAAVRGPIADALTEGSRAVRGHAEAIAGACVANAGAKAAADVALHDAWARQLGLPLVTALGGDLATPLHGDMTVSLTDPEDMADRAAEAAGRGHDILKVKLGSDWRADLERLRAVVDAAPGAALRLDANQGWDVKSAIRIITAIEEAGPPVQRVEQPVDRHDRACLGEVTRAVGTPILPDAVVASSA